MTTILCDKVNCMYNTVRTDMQHGCKCTALGIGVDLKCDSYMDMPEVVKKQVVEGRPAFCRWPDGFCISYEAMMDCGNCASLIKPAT